MWPHQCWVEGKHHLPRPASNTLSNTAEGTIRLLCSKGTLLAYVQPGVHQDPQVLFCQPASQLGGLQHISVHRVVPPEVQDFTLPLVERCEVPGGPFLQLLKIPLDGSLTLWHICHSSHFGVICKLAEGTLLRFAGEDDKENMQYSAIVKWVEQVCFLGQSWTGWD